MNITLIGLQFCQQGKTHLPLSANFTRQNRIILNMLPAPMHLPLLWGQTCPSPYETNPCSPMGRRGSQDTNPSSKQLSQSRTTPPADNHPTAKDCQLAVKDKFKAWKDYQTGAKSYQGPGGGVFYIRDTVDAVFCAEFGAEHLRGV